jgi:N-acetylmuramoyl-L-alanine amidase
MRRVLSVFLFIVAWAVSPAQLKGKVVCIDPGHPSEVGRGTHGRQLTEVQVAWDMAIRVKERLEKLGAKVVLTKSSRDQVVKNKARAEVANRSKADFMLRLHCDAAAGSGFASYYPTQQGTSQGVKGPSPELLKRLPPIAKRFHEALAKGMKGQLPDLGLKSDLKTAIGGKQGALTGSIFSHVPVVLVEMVVLTNPKDEAYIAGPEGKSKFADALTQGVVAALSNKH